ncbi:hypothetical protein QZH41_004619 [Actinostola sp. cb2023]|nr:hypothetical protein QZH41_004619 [Actinostola sp. cb2023]
MNQKLDKLDDKFESHLARIDQDIRDLKHSCTYVHETTDELTSKLKVHDDILKDVNERIDKIGEENTKLHEDLLDLRVCSMKSNLVFYNLPEEEKEDPFSVVQKVLEKMEMNSSGIEIERAHRLGKKVDSKTRPIIAKFRRYQDKEYIRQRAYMLKGSKIGIAEQFLKEIAERRKLLYPILKKAKSEGKKAVLIKDVLFINGQRYRGSS